MTFTSDTVCTSLQHHHSQFQVTYTHDSDQINHTHLQITNPQRFPSIVTSNQRFPSIVTSNATFTCVKYLIAGPRFMSVPRWFDAFDDHVITENSGQLIKQGAWMQCHLALPCCVSLTDRTSDICMRTACIQFYDTWCARTTKQLQFMMTSRVYAMS